MNNKSNEKSGEKSKGIDSSKIVLDDAGRFELNDEQLDEVSGGMRNRVCHIQTSSEGCSMNM